MTACGNELTVYRLPTVDHTDSNIFPTGIIQETSYKIDVLNRYFNENELKLLPDQQLVYNYILEFVHAHKEKKLSSF